MALALCLAMHGRYARSTLSELQDQVGLSALLGGKSQDHKP